VPRGSVPLVSELEARIDEAVVIARASEEGVREVGEMALDAARQARRAAEAAESASATAAAAVSARPEGKLSFLVDPRSPGPNRPRPGRDAEARLRSFNERADRLLARVQAV
jgi:hypothetical protein